MSSLLLVAMFLFFTVPSILFKLYFFSIAFTIYGAIFGFEEFMAVSYTGRTVSQQIWQLIISKKARGYKLLAYMLFGCISWLLHFFVMGWLANLLLLFAFLLLAIPSLIYREYFLTLASIIFVLTIGFTDSLSLQMLGKTIAVSLRELIANHPIQGGVIVMGTLLGWLCLLAHLGLRFKK